MIMTEPAADKPIKEISRQRRYQLRMRDEGRCVLCGKKLATATHCAQHAKMHRTSQLRRYYEKIRPKRYPHLVAAEMTRAGTAQAVPPPPPPAPPAAPPPSM
jgi:hypothetical protein